MIRTLRIEKFQSHRKTVLQLVEGVNVVFGTSLHGKTAIIRAFNLLLNNRPSGAKYFSNFAGDSGITEIEAILENGVMIKIKKHVSKDRKTKEKKLDDTVYWLGEQDFSGVSKSVPDEIVRIFNMTELNIQRQFDQPFLIIGTAGEFAKTINQVTKLDKPDDWVSELTKRINETNRETKVFEGQAKEIEIELAHYIGFENLQQQSRLLAKIVDELEANIKRANKIDDCLDRIETIDDKLKSIRPAMEIERDIASIVGAEQAIQRLEKVQELIDRVIKVDTLIEGLQQLLQASSEIEEILLLESQLDEINYAIGRIERLDNIITNLRQLVADMEILQDILDVEENLFYINDISGKVEKINREIWDLGEEYEEAKITYLSLLRAEPRCPIFNIPCNIDEKMIKTIEERL